MYRRRRSGRLESLDATVLRPGSGWEAFAWRGRVATWTQVALLIGLATQLRGRHELLDELGQDRRTLGLPYVPPLERPVTAAHLNGVAKEFRVAPLSAGPRRSRRLRSRATEPALPERRDPNDSTSDRRRGSQRDWIRRAGPLSDRNSLWTAVQNANGEAALALLLAAFETGPTETQVAAAAGLAVLMDAPLLEIASVLRTAARGDDENMRHLALTALAQSIPDDPILRPGADDDQRDPPEAIRTSVLVNGTFARWKGRWWRPGGSFHAYIKSDVSKDLYGGGDYFRWPGGYTDDSRHAGAEDLVRWCNAKGVDTLDTVYAHSHGGSVVMLATRLGLRVRQLVLLSVPVHAHLLADWAMVGRAVSFRARFDPVVLLDGGGHYFSPPVREQHLPIWISHSATHEPRVWRKFRLDEELAWQRLLPS